MKKEKEKKKKKLVIYDNKGNETEGRPLPDLVDKSKVNWWAARLFARLRKSAKDRDKVDHWDVLDKEV